MATYHGTSGSVLFTSAATTTDGIGTDNEAQCYQWSLNLRHDVVDVTPFNPSSNFKRFIGGMSDATGTVSFYLEGQAPHATLPTNLEDVIAFSTADKAPNTLLLKTKASGSGKSFSFGALLSNLTVDVERQGVIRCTADFESSGLITIANVA
jgi:hypothetical protein